MVTSSRKASTPLWASLQVESVCARAQVSSPNLAWGRSRVDRGCYNPAFPAITVWETFEVGHARAAEITLLHELAHHLSHLVAASSGHSPAFWELAWRLYLDQGIPMHEAVYGECSYHVGAEKSLRTLLVDLDPLLEAAVQAGIAGRRFDRLESRLARLERTQPHLLAPLDLLRAKVALSLTARKRYEKTYLALANTTR